MSQDTNQEVENNAEKTATQEASTEKTNTQEDNASQVDETAESVASTEESNEIDYKAELEAAQKQLSQAEHTIVEVKRENRELRQNATADVEPQYEVEPNDEERVAKIRAELQADHDKFKKELTQDIVSDELSKLSDNPDERALIQFHYENSIRQSGFTRSAIQSDLQAASLLANKKRLMRENAELKEALKAKASVGQAATGSNQDTQKPFEMPKLSPQDKAMLERTAAKHGQTLREYLEKNPQVLKSLNPQNG